MSSPSPLSRFGSSSNSTNSLISTSIPTNVEEPTPIDLLLQTPPAVLRLLTLASPIIESTLILVQLITWTHPSFFSSLLVLLSWWSICLFGRIILKFGLPLLLLLYVLVKYISNISTRSTPLNTRHHSRPLTLTPASYSHLLQSSQTLATYAHSLRTNVIKPIKIHLNFTPYQAGKAAPIYHTAWFAITSYPFYLLLTWLVPMRIILLILGSIGILWNAPFFSTSRHILWQSAAVRWSCRIIYGLLSGGKGLKKEWSRTKSGVGITGLLGKIKVKKGEEERPVKAKYNSIITEGLDEGKKEEVLDGDDVKLQFTVFENQRWWVGLDWTHALLPGERASWTDPALNPSSPPSSFVLPPPTVMYTPAPTKLDPNARLKTTTEWKWLDPEWKVLRTATTPLTPTPSSPPPLLNLLPKSISTSSLLSPSSPLSINTTSRSTIASSSISNTVPSSPINNTIPTPTIISEDLNNPFSIYQVDDDGWQYGDNHFEKMGPKGGLGKYTRRRAWIRNAGLVERCEKVGGDKISLINEKERDRLISTTIATTTTGNGMNSNGSSTSSIGISRTGSPKIRKDSTSRERSTGGIGEKRSESPSIEGDMRRRKSATGSTLKNSSSPIEE